MNRLSLSNDMRTVSAPSAPALLTLTGAVLAGGAVGLLSLFPGVALIGAGMVLLSGVCFVAGRLASRTAAGGRVWVRTPLDLPVLLILLQMGVSFWASALPQQSRVALAQLGSGLVALFAVVNWSRDRRRLWGAVAVVVLIGTGLALIAPFAVDWFRDRKTFLPAALYRFFPLLLPDAIHPNVMAGALATLLPLSLALFLVVRPASRRQTLARAGMLLAAVLQIGILVLTKSRGGYIALGVALWLALWLSGRRRWALGLAVVAVLTLTWLLLSPPTASTAEVDPTVSALDASTWAFRQQVWHAALQIIGDFPFTGAGIGTFNDVAALLYGFYSPDNPGAHNLFLQAGVDLGIPGLIAFLAVWLVALWSAYQAYRLFDQSGEPTLRAVAIGTLAGLAATLAHGLVDSHTWGSKGAFIPWLLIGLAVALHSLALAGRADAAAEPEVSPP